MQRKTKFASAAKKKQQAQLAEEWNKLQATWANVPKFGSGKPPKPAKKSPEKQPINNERIPSLGEWVTGAVTTKASQQYTGTKMLGIGTMHKSNAVPIFSQDEASDISKMRR